MHFSRIQRCYSCSWEVVVILPSQDNTRFKTTHLIIVSHVRTFKSFTKLEKKVDVPWFCIRIEVLQHKFTFTILSLQTTLYGLTTSIRQKENATQKNTLQPTSELSWALKSSLPLTANVYYAETQGEKASSLLWPAQQHFCSRSPPPFRCIHPNWWKMQALSSKENEVRSV